MLSVVGCELSVVGNVFVLCSLFFALCSLFNYQILVQFFHHFRIATRFTVREIRMDFANGRLKLRHS